MYVLRILHLLISYHSNTDLNRLMLNRLSDKWGYTSYSNPAKKTHLCLGGQGALGEGGGLGALGGLGHLG